MFSPRQLFPIDIRTGWVDYSPALRYHASQRVRSRLAGFAPQIRSAIVQFLDEDPQTPEQRRCEIKVTTADGIAVTASASGAELFTLVERALDGVVSAMRQRKRLDARPELHQRIA